MSANPTISRSRVTAGPSSTKNIRAHSCVLCQQRKVKCDRKDPCSNCIKARVDCVFRTPLPPRRRKKVHAETVLAARLKRYEELLKSHGVKIDDDSGGGGIRKDPERMQLDVSNPAWQAMAEYKKRGEPASKGVEQQTAHGARERLVGKGKLVSEGGVSRYLDNSLWTSLSEELPDSQDVLEESSEYDSVDEPANQKSSLNIPDGSGFIFSSRHQHASLTSLHPQPTQIFRLWQTFLDNVNPLVKVFHAPTVQQSILEATGHLETVSKPMEALMFSIYSSAVASLSDKDCDTKFGESKQPLQRRYQMAAEQALVNAGFLKSLDLTVLQAYFLFLLSVRNFYDPRSLWILTGMAVRIGQRIGLHSDEPSQGMSFFQIEMRRRLWWQIVIFDTRAAELSGSGISLVALLLATKLPLNVNDSDLYPDMRDPPVEHTGATEMMFCLLRYEVGNFFRGITSAESFDGSWHSLNSPITPLAMKDKAIDELQILLEQKYVRHCDPLIPLHFIARMAAKAIIGKMRLVAHHPRQYQDGDAKMPQEEKDMLFITSLEIMELDNLTQGTKICQRFMWNAKVNFQLDAFVYLLSQLRVRMVGELVNRAWIAVSEIYEHHPELINETKNLLYIAVGNLTIKVWEAREATFFVRHQQSPSGLAVPQYITKLYSQRRVPKAENTQAENGGLIKRHTDYPQSEESTLNQIRNGQDQSDYIDSGFDASLSSDSVSMDFSPMDWAYWDNLIQGFQSTDDNIGQQFYDPTYDYKYRL